MQIKKKNIKKQESQQKICPSYFDRALDVKGQYWISTPFWEHKLVCIYFKTDVNLLLLRDKNLFWTREWKQIFL